MKNKIMSIIGVLALTAGVSCGGSGSNLPEVTPTGPSPDFSNLPSVESDLDSAFEVLVNSLGQTEIPLFEDDDTESDTSTLQSAEEEGASFPYDLSKEVSVVSGSISGTLTLTGIIDGTVTEEGGDLTLEDVTFTFVNFSDDEGNVVDGTFSFDGDLDITEAGASVNVLSSVALVVSGNVGMSIEGSARFIADLGDENSSGNVSGNITVSSADGNSATCTVSGDISQSEDSIFNCGE